MASKHIRPNGDVWIFTKCSNGKRKAVRMGPLPADEADEAKRRLSLLEAAFKADKAPDPVTAAWVASLNETLHRRVLSTGLAGEGGNKPPKCKQTLTVLIAKWQPTLDVTEATYRNYKMVTRSLRDFFGDDREVATITPAEADAFAKWLRVKGRRQGDKPLSRAATSRRLRQARTILQFAVRLRWIEESPFSHIKSRGETNPLRNYYVTQRLVDAIIKACPDPELAAMVALCRYVTFRGLSEFAGLKWGDIHFGREEVLVKSPKTQRHPGGESRIAPIGPAAVVGKSEEVVAMAAKAKAAIDRLWDASPKGVEYVFPRLREVSSAAINQKLEAVCRDIGVAMWCKPWPNMRASCETDWVLAGVSIFETARWTGHSPDIALKHYNRIAKDRVADLPQCEAREAKHTDEQRSDVRNSQSQSPENDR